MKRKGNALAALTLAAFATSLSAGEVQPLGILSIGNRCSGNAHRFLPQKDARQISFKPNSMSPEDAAVLSEIANRATHPTP